MKGMFMTLLRVSARILHERSRGDALAGELRRRYVAHFVRTPPDGEQAAWRNSLRALADVLIDAGLEDVEVLLEYRLPFTSLRADVVLAGVHPRTGRPSYVVVELKQWEDARLARGTEDLCLVRRSGNRPWLHPLVQVGRYCDYLGDFTSVLGGDEEGLAGFVYLHNAKDEAVQDLYRMPTGRQRQIFTETTSGALKRELRLRLAPESGALAADRLLGSSHAPSVQLLHVAADEITGNGRFVLLDEQQVAVSLVKRAVDLSHQSNTKEAIVVSGGPGSGKSAIAVHLLGALASDGRSVVHATGSKSFTTTLRHYVGRRRPRVGNVFQYFNGFSRARPNRLDVLICDEAHRVRQISTDSGSTRRAQIDELLDAARVPVFLLDDHQIVRPDEMGSVEAIREAAHAKGMISRLVRLADQYRSGGSEAFDVWVLRLLGLERGGPVRWVGDDRFQLRVADSPSELEDFLRARQGVDTAARMTAGFCWPWSPPGPDGRLVADVRIGDWHRPWNVKEDRPVGGAPASSLWATDPAGFGQIGCIYTAQGFEYDWNGVIFGPDLVWRGDRWRGVPSASKDSKLARTETDVFERLVRNTYKVLLTRGMVGTVVFSTDPETQELLRALIPQGS